MNMSVILVHNISYCLHGLRQTYLIELKKRKTPLGLIVRKLEEADLTSKWSEKAP